MHGVGILFTERELSSALSPPVQNKHQQSDQNGLLPKKNQKKNITNELPLNPLPPDSEAKRVS